MKIRVETVKTPEHWEHLSLDAQLRDYDAYTCVPKWARTTLKAHRRDRREHTYTRSELERGKTHDPYWNAAMTELKASGYMHNHMRMYWGKKKSSGRLRRKRLTRPFSPS